MSINPNVRDLNNRLTNLERCVEVAPEGSYLRAADAVVAIGEAAEGIMKALRGYGFKAPGHDGLRSLEAAIYGYLLDNNPDEYGLITGEGFGEHVDGPAGERVLANAIRD